VQKGDRARRRIAYGRTKERALSGACIVVLYRFHLLELGREEDALELAHPRMHAHGVRVGEGHGFKGV
jgi:hypothetical protein